MRSHIPSCKNSIGIHSFVICGRGKPEAHTNTQYRSVIWAVLCRAVRPRRGALRMSRRVSALNVNMFSTQHMTLRRNKPPHAHMQHKLKPPYLTFNTKRRCNSNAQRGGRAGFFRCIYSLLPLRLAMQQCSHWSERRAELYYMVVTWLPVCVNQPYCRERNKRLQLKARPRSAASLVGCGGGWRRSSSLCHSEVVLRGKTCGGTSVEEGKEGSLVAQ